MDGCTDQSNPSEWLATISKEKKISKNKEWQIKNGDFLFMTVDFEILQSLFLAVTQICVQERRISDWLSSIQIYFSWIDMESEVSWCSNHFFPLYSAWTIKLIVKRYICFSSIVSFIWLHFNQSVIILWQISRHMTQLNYFLTNDIWR